MSSTPPRFRFATLDSSLLARKGEARPALSTAFALDEAAPFAAVEEAQRGVPPELARPFAGPLLAGIAPRPLPGPDAVDQDAADSVATVPVERLRSAGKALRSGSGDVAALARSVKAQGVVQPIVVRPDAARPGAWEVIAGARRFEAAKLAGLAAVPVVVRALADVEALELALVENLQREDLAPLDEAAGYRRLVDEFGKSHDQIAALVGRSRSHVANTIRLLGLPEEVKGLVAQGRLSAGHARALLAADDPVAASRTVVARGLNVRETERLVAKSPHAAARASSSTAAPEVAALRIAAWLGLPVVLRRTRRGGALTIRFRTEAEFARLLDRLAPRDRASTTPALQAADTSHAEGL
jgi:ParB family chromosome partitioning protein